MIRKTSGVKNHVVKTVHDLLGAGHEKDPAGLGLFMKSIGLPRQGIY